MKIPFIQLAGVKRKKVSSTGSKATALNLRQTPSPGLAQGSGSLQANEAISYGSVPLNYVHSSVPRKANVGKPLHQRTNFVVPTAQRKKAQPVPQVSHGRHV